MTIRAQTNLYPGVNPHLNSYFQNQTGWRGFHSVYIVAMLQQLTANLPDGYFAVGEQSLQIGTYDVDAEITVPDATVYTVKPEDEPIGTPNPAPMLTVDVLATIPEDDYIPAVTVYIKDETRDFPGVALLRMEVLSPANKPPRSHHKTYLSKRSKVLQAGLSLLEIDLLHQQQPIVSAIPSYRSRDEGAKPYYIIFTDPRPKFHEGKTYLYGVGVLEPLPTITLPLVGEDTVTLDFNAAYMTAFGTSGLYSWLSDYAQPPENFAAYTDADQAAIQAHMAHIANQQEE